MYPEVEIELPGTSSANKEGEGAGTATKAQHDEATASPRSPSSPQAGATPISLISKMRINDGVENPHGLSNRITTTKYSLLSWLPKSLFEQFRRIANIYFLGISILMLIGTYAPVVFTTPLEPFSTLGTLIFVLLVTSVKEGYEDVKRARSDEIENTRRITVCTFDDNGKLVETETETQYIKAGDIIKLHGHCQVPADLILMMTSFFDDGNKCYVETANIDGETNLKLREAPSALLSAVKSGQVKKELFHGHLEYEPPNKNIHNFIGTLYVDNLEPVPLCADNLLLRASIFSNTEWGYGIAVYTGNETKIQMNNREAPSKMSKLEEYVNEAIILIFFAQVVLVSISVISLYATGFQDESKLPYVFPPNADSSSNASALPLWLEQWFVFFILYNNFIPISLYVTIELVNLGQGYLMSTDLNMYEESVDMPCVVRSSNLAQELGVVSNIFSDKTGTLTRNEMRFVKFVVGNKMFEVGDADAESIMDSARRGADETFKKVYDFFFCLATCHTVIREKNGTYRAESPDELALVEGVGRYKCGIQERGTSHMLVDMMGQIESYDVLAVNAFNSDRKRMSILLRQRNTNTYKLLCKGADSVMVERLSLSVGEHHTVDKSLLDLASVGLRTLVVASKNLSENDALSWVERWKAAAASLQDRADLLAAAAEDIEKDMTLLGITAIEDRLQDEVPEVIAELAQAGIVLWMLTGDKEETAISIGYSCNLLTPTTELHFLARIKSDEEYYNSLKSVHDAMVERIERSKAESSKGTGAELALVMDGPSFKHFDERNPVHRQYLLKIGQMCRSVIACRLTPVQKQQLVALVKVDSVPKATTLSIGDGANDVSMIREANVGVGIIGKEGRQAANNADFAIGQFKFLRSLLLIHGRWNYIRQSRVFLYSMHKNMAITLTLFWFSYYAALSGTSMYNSWVYSGFNFALGLPIIFYGFMDRDIPSSYAYDNPGVYKTGFTNSQLDKLTVGLWILNACVFSAVFCMMFFLVLEPTFESFDLFEMGTVIYIGLVLSLQLKVSFLHQVWNYIHVLAMAISIIGIFVVVYIISLSVDQYDYYGVVEIVYSRGIFWFFGVFSIPLTCILIDVTAYSLSLFFFPPDEAIFREAAFGMYKEVSETTPMGRLRAVLNSDNVNEAKFGL